MDFRCTSFAVEEWFDNPTAMATKPSVFRGVTPCSQLKSTSNSLYAYLEPSPLLLWTSIGPLYQPWMIDRDDCGEISAMNEWQRKPDYSEETCPLSPSLSQFSHDITLARTRATAVGIQRPTAWATARPLSSDRTTLYSEEEFVRSEEGFLPWLGPCI
jgi:type IV secretory pathway TrbF-like protein